MELLLILLFIVFVARVSSLVSQKSYKQELLENIKLCPPHKWFYDEVKDAEGKVVRCKIVCRVCGPLRPQEKTEKMDY